MSLHRPPLPPSVPAETARIARAAFPKGNPYLTLRDDLGPVFAICALFVLFSATQDIAADALAVRLLTDSGRGIGNGIQVGGNYLGSVVGGGLALVVYDRWGWVPAILLLALLTATALGVVIGFREPTREVQVRRPSSSVIVTS